MDDKFDPRITPVTNKNEYESYDPIVCEYFQVVSVNVSAELERRAMVAEEKLKIALMELQKQKTDAENKGVHLFYVLKEIEEVGKEIK